MVSLFDRPCRLLLPPLPPTTVATRSSPTLFGSSARPMSLDGDDDGDVVVVVVVTSPEAGDQTHASSLQLTMT
jgi:hypothetical protein